MADLSMLYALCKTLLLPPAGNILLLVLAPLIALRWRTLATLISLFSLTTLWLMATPNGALWLSESLETPVASVSELQQAQAIVVLGGGDYPAAPEYTGDTLPSLLAQQRLLYAAHLHQQYRLPILTSGGHSRTGGHRETSSSEAELMAHFLKQHLDTPTWQIEGHSLTSWENALYSAPLLKKAGIDTVLLVSQAWHLPRAQYAFEVQGLTVIPAGTGYYRPRTHRFSGQYWLPEIEALTASYWAIHELVGLGWYRLKHKTRAVLSQEKAAWFSKLL